MTNEPRYRQSPVSRSYSTHCAHRSRHRDEKPVTASPLESARLPRAKSRGTNPDARNHFGFCSYENCRVSLPPRSIFRCETLQNIAFSTVFCAKNRKPFSFFSITCGHFSALRGGYTFHPRSFIQVFVSPARFACESLLCFHGLAHSSKFRIL